MALVIKGSSSGQITVDVPSASGTNTLTLPAKTGNIDIQGSAFKAYLGSNQSISADTHTKVQFNTEDFDTGSEYDNSSNYRFTPTTGGYYMLNTQLFTDSGSARTIIRFRKNGSEISNYDLTASTINCISTSTLVNANGTGDYFEVFVQFVGSGKTLASGQTNTFFSGHFVRGT